MLHNEITYPNPHEFEPDRFMTPDGRLDPLAKDPAPLFGFGRRYLFLAYTVLFV